MCTLHVSHSPLTGFLPSWGAAPVMPRWPNRVSKQEDLYTREKRSCTQRIRSRSRAKRQVEPVPFRSVPRAKVWEADALQRDLPRRTPLEGTEFLAKPKDHLRWLSKDLAAVAPERWFARLVVPTKHEAKVWPMQEDDLAKRCLFNGYQGSVYDVESKGKDGRWRKAVMKLPPESKLGLKDAIAYNWPSPDKTMAADDQLWLCAPCVDDKPYFFLCNRSLGAQVMEIRGNGIAASLRMSEFNGSDNQKWTVDEDSRLASKLDCGCSAEKVKFCVDVVGAQDANSASVCAYAANGGCNQQWQLEVVDKDASIRLVRIVSKMAGKRLLTVENGDQMRKDMILEICYLSLWSGELGLVQLQKVVWNHGVPEAIIEERLGKQLGKGTGSDDKACVLQDIRAGTAFYSPAMAARSLLAVAQVLRRIHHDGFVYNDLHDGNILRRIDIDSYKVIDLGSVTRADRWQKDLGPNYDGRWSRNRDWRAFALAFLELILGRQLDMWRLVGTNNSITSPAKDAATGVGLECHWSSPFTEEKLPEDVEAMLMEQSWIAWAPGMRPLLQSLFAYRVDDNDVCWKLWRLSGT